jgi:predicted DCC family thiol-disulfide oxidoreductase YuxK
MASVDFENKQIVLFDGICNLCEGTVQFLIKNNKAKNLYFASLQSEFGQSILRNFGLPLDDFSSFIYFENNKIYQQSTAALQVIKHLKGAWPLMGVFVIVPSFIRNGIYNYISKNRFNWFGQKTECWLPSSELKNRFLE